MGKNTSIILGDHFDRFIKEELERGQYASASEIIRSGLRKLEEEKIRNDRINQALIIGENSGQPRLFNNEHFKQRMNYQNRITSNPKVLLGKPTIKGTRISVELILRKISGGYSFDEIVEMYPHISKEDILACVAYAASVIESEETLQDA